MPTSDACSRFDAHESPEKVKDREMSTPPIVGNNKSGRAVMRARARLISLIGDELISDEPVAVVELVKNAYDADAKKVRVAFSGANASDPDTLTVSDDGCGMKLETVLGAWLEPGTILKKHQERSPGKRLFQGAKGIGRFANCSTGRSPSTWKQGQGVKSERRHRASRNGDDSTTKVILTRSRSIMKSTRSPS